MNAPAVALLSSVFWGSSDFVGGLQARRLPTIVVVLWSQLLAGLLLLGAVAAVQQWSVTAPAAGWALATGACGAAGLLCFYRALAVGAMSLVAPIAACGVVVPVFSALLTGRAPGAVALGGALLGLLGMVVLARTSSTDERGSGSSSPRFVLLALGAALGFGLFLALAARASMDARRAPLLVTLLVRAGAVGLQAVVIAARRVRVAAPPVRSIAPIVFISVTDCAANLLYVLATRHGNLAVTSVLGSLYPAVTVLLAAVLLRERLARAQWVSVAVILVAVVMMASGS